MGRIDNLEFLLASDNLNESVIQLDDFICALCQWGKNLEALTDGQKIFYYNQNLEREVNNGGFSQYFVNSSGDFAHETILSLKAIGAAHTADILQSAIDQFPGKRVSKNRNERNDFLERIENITSEKLEELDQAFFEYKDNLNLLNIEFVKEHLTQF